MGWSKISRSVQVDGLRGMYGLKSVVDPLLIGLEMLIEAQKYRVGFRLGWWLNWLGFRSSWWVGSGFATPASSHVCKMQKWGAHYWIFDSRKERKTPRPRPPPQQQQNKKGDSFEYAYDIMLPQVKWQYIQFNIDKKEKKRKTNTTTNNKGDSFECAYDIMLFLT